MSRNPFLVEVFLDMHNGKEAQGSQPLFFTEI